MQCHTRKVMIRNSEATKGHNYTMQLDAQSILTEVQGAHRQAELEGKLAKVLKDVWVIIHLDSDFIKAGFEVRQVVCTQKSQA